MGHRNAPTTEDRIGDTSSRQPPAALTEWQLAMATAVLAMLPPVGVVILMQRLFVKGLVETEK